MNGSPNTKMVLAYRPKPRKQLSTVTSLAFVGVVLFVVALFWKGHSDVMRIHTSLHSPILEQAAGWAALHRTTTVQSATVSISGSHITGSALTATTTELQTTGQGSAGQQAAAQAASAVVAAAAATNSSHRTSHSLASMLGDLQHSLYTMLALHSAGGKISRAQLAAAAAASMPDEGRDIELHPHKVAQVVDRARVVQQLQRLANGEAGADVPGESDVRSSAEQTADLYGASVGTVVFTVDAGALASCPAASASPGAAQAAVVLMAGNSTAALIRSLAELAALYSRASSDVRSAYHLYVVVDDSRNKDLAGVATSYVHDTLGAVKLVRYVAQQDGKQQVMGKSTEDKQQQQQQTAHTAANKDMAVIATARHRVLSGDKSTEVSTKRPPQSVTSTEVAGVGQPPGDHKQQLASKQHDALTTNSSSSSQGSHSKAPTTTASFTPCSSSRIVHRALHTFLRCFNYPAVILLEDDLTYAPDLLDFFYSTQWLLSSDSSLYCLSAWNPQGHQQQAVQPFRLIRTDTHPAKSWYVTAQLGVELLQKWPASGSEAAVGAAGCDSVGDNVIQQLLLRADIRRGRQCVVPEMPRVSPAPAAAAGDAAEGVKSFHHAQATSAPDVQAVTQQVQLKAADYAIYSGDSNASADSDVEVGDVDLKTYLQATLQDSNETGVEHEDLPVLHMQHELASDVDVDSSAQQQQQQQQESGSDAVGRHGHHDWLHEDLSLLLDNEYGHQMHQVLRSAGLCTVSSAAVLRDTHTACVVTYSSAAYLSAAAHRLGMPVKVHQGVRYCFNLPETSPSSSSPGGPHQQCQDYFPEMAWRGIISGYNRHNVRVFLVHTKYLQALKQMPAVSEA